MSIYLLWDLSLVNNKERERVVEEGVERKLVHFVSH